MKRSDRDRAVALLLTLLIYVAVVVLCLLTGLRFPPGGEPLPQPQPEETEILYGGEYVMLGDDPTLDVNADDQMATPEEEAADASEADDIADAGTPAAEPAKVVTSKQESPMKVKEKPKPEKTGPTKEELAAQEKARREKEAAEQIKRKVSFSGTGTGTGKAGSPDGNSTQGAASGAPGHDLAGRTIEAFDRPSGTMAGTIRVRVRVNSKGQVVSATYDGGSGSAAGNVAQRQSCVEASRRSRFSVRTDSQGDQSGVITWRFR